MRLGLVEIILLLLLAAIVAVGFSRHENRIAEQDRLGRIASEIAGRQVGVRCPGFLAGLVDVHGEAGRVSFDAAGRPADHTDLSPQTCKELLGLARVDFSCVDRGAECGYRQFSAGWAAHTLAHESFHLRGVQDEGVAECYAFQDTAFVAVRLGVPPETARKLTGWLFVRGYPNEPPDYHSSRCYAGGPLDIRHGSPAWP